MAALQQIRAMKAMRLFAVASWGLLSVRADDTDTCQGFDEMWGLCPDLPTCGDCTPIDCEFGDWGEWYEDFGKCTGLRFHERTVRVSNNECGKPCSGPKIESVEHVPAECLLQPVDCVLSDWSMWSACESTTGQVNRNRKVVIMPNDGGEPCTGSTEETMPCGVGPTPVPCAFTEWQEWTACSSSCGSGRHTRMRRVLNEAQHSGESCEGMTLETEPCFLQECSGTDCAVGDWSDWSMCDPERHPQRFRRRQVLEAATGVGKRCNQTLRETQGCPAVPKEACRLSEWSEWTALGWREPNPPICSKECGGGQTFRTRIMQAPPNHGGSCPDSSLRELKACNTMPCNFVCELTEWSQWSTCSAECGQGTTTRKRELVNPFMRFNEGCQGALEEALTCLGKNGECPSTDCAWSNWQDWTPCSASCGGGLARRSREILTEPSFGGTVCEALTKSEAAPCNTHSCGEDCIDGQWGVWQDWEVCTATCSSAYTVRRRTIAQDPNTCGKPVSGIGHEYKACSHLPPCIVDNDCLLSDWSEWSFCSATCYGVHERNRYIKGFPSGNGAHCDMTSLKEMAPCNPDAGKLAVEECQLPGPTDCLFGDWSAWTPCSKSCGGGQRERRRKILELPQNGGLPCTGDLTTVGPCNPEACEAEMCTDCAWGMWSEWGDCSKCNGQKYRHRSVEQMPNHCGRMCDLRSAKEVTNCTGPCKAELFCTWTDWSVPSGCAPGCGQGTMMRSRALSLQAAPTDGFLFVAPAGSKCQGAQLNMSTCPQPKVCEAKCIPMNCAFHEWGEWSPPASTGLCERHRTISTMNNECGLPCSGALGETKACVLPNPDRRDCAMSDWTAWGECSMNGKIGHRQRHRAVIQQPSFDGAACDGTLSETTPCNLYITVDCSLSEWGEWETCKKSCGGGWQARSRTLLVPGQHGGKLCQDSLEELQMCNTEACLEDHQDCQYSEWTSWTGCGAHGQRYRERQISQFASKSGELCQGDLEETSACGETEKVDCLVSGWTSWDPCDKTCGGGQTQRQRQIMVFPAGGGEACPEELVQTVGCNRNQCTFQDCLAGDWAEWSSCSASCGVAHKTRQREVVHMRNPGGIGCSLELSQLSACTNEPCPMDDCTWGEWADWNSCSSSCGGGQQSRLRSISKMPMGGGKFCPAQDKEEVKPCNTQQCEAKACEDGEWGQWQDWTACSESCGGGTTYRVRQVLRMANSCGQAVTGDARETRICNNDVGCEPTVDCLFSDWGVWTACSLTCNGVMQRSRRIERYGSGDGAYCEGGLKETAPCNPTMLESTPAGCAEEPPVDCQLGEWTEWGDCSVSCGGGEHAHSRDILRLPASGGKACEGPLAVVRQCGMEKCPGPAPVDCAYGEWQDWGACGKCGGERTRFRHIRQYAKHGGKVCEPFEAEEVTACPRQCHEKLYCAWGDWAQWGECSARCGQGKRMRRRYLGLTAVPSIPPEPVTEMVNMYSELRQQTLSLQNGHQHELVVAFTSGFLFFVAAFMGVRVFLTARFRGHTSRGIRHMGGMGSTPRQRPQRSSYGDAQEGSAAEPLVVGA